MFDYDVILAKKVKLPKESRPIGDTYKVQEDDTFWGLARGRDFEAVDLEKVNPGVDLRGLKIGQIINVPNKSKGNMATNKDRQSAAYHGNLIQRYLESISENGSYDARKGLAAKYSISNYSGTAAKNIQLLGIIRDGKKHRVHKLRHLI